MKRIAFLLLLCLVLAGCQRRRAYFPAAKEMTAQHVEVVRFDSALLVDGQTDDGLRFIDNKRITGTIPDMVDEAVSFVKKNSRVSTVIDADGQRREFGIDCSWWWV